MAVLGEHFRFLGVEDRPVLDPFVAQVAAASPDVRELHPVVLFAAAGDQSREEREHPTLVFPTIHGPTVALWAVRFLDSSDPSFFSNRLGGCGSNPT